MRAEDEAPIPIFAVGDSATAMRLLRDRAILVSYAWLGSGFVPWADVPYLIALSRFTVADSGAFTIWQRRLKHKCEACGDRYAEPGSLCDRCVQQRRAVMSVETWAAFIVDNAHRIRTFLSLDVIGDAEGSMRNWEALLRAVPRELHPQLVPVWHEGDPAEHLDAYDPSSRLVAIGRTTGRQAGSKGAKATRTFYDAAFNAYPDGAYWALGNSTPEYIEPYPFRCFDATSWQRDAAYTESLGWRSSRVGLARGDAKA